MDQVLWWLYLSDLCHAAQVVLGLVGLLLIILRKPRTGFGMIIIAMILPDPAVFKLKGLNLLYGTQTMETCLEISKIYDHSIKCPISSNPSK